MKATLVALGKPGGLISPSCWFIGARSGHRAWRGQRARAEIGGRTRDHMVSQTSVRIYGGSRMPAAEEAVRILRWDLGAAGLRYEAASSVADSRALPVICLSWLARAGVPFKAHSQNAMRPERTQQPRSCRPVVRGHAAGRARRQAHRSDTLDLHVRNPGPPANSHHSLGPFSSTTMSPAGVT
jgi:hypothetical protein